MYIFNFVPMFQRSSPLWYATWNNLYYTFNFVPMFQRSRHFWYAFWFYLQIFNFVPMFQRSRHLWYPLWFYLLTIGFANHIWLPCYLISLQVLRRQNSFYVLPDLTSIPFYLSIKNWDEKCSDIASYFYDPFPQTCLMKSHKSKCKLSITRYN